MGTGKIRMVSGIGASRCSRRQPGGPGAGNGDGSDGERVARLVSYLNFGTAERFRRM